MKKPRVQIFIPTFNRLHLARLAVESVLGQDFRDFEVILSDNSTNNETARVFEKFQKPNFIYRRRIPCVGVLEHFDLMLSEVSSEYFMIFHDDDLMEPNGLSILVGLLDRYSQASAVAGNAFFLSGKKTNRKFLKHHGELLIQSPLAMAKRYLINLPVPPFAAYLYRSKQVENIRLEKERGGKHADVSFLFDVAKTGPVVFSSSVVMAYRLHGGQDSAKYCIGDQEKLVGFLARELKLSRRSAMVTRFRVNWLMEWCSLRIRHPHWKSVWRRMTRIFCLRLMLAPFPAVFGMFKFFWKNLRYFF